MSQTKSRLPFSYHSDIPLNQIGETRHFIHYSFMYFNLLHPKIGMHILLTVHYMFPIVLTQEIQGTIKSVGGGGISLFPRAFNAQFSSETMRRQKMPITVIGERVNPLHPNISMHILPTVLYIFPKEMSQRTCSKIKGFSGG